MHQMGQKNYCPQHQRVLNHRPKMHAGDFELTMGVPEKEAKLIEGGVRCAAEDLALSRTFFNFGPRKFWCLWACMVRSVLVLCPVEAA